MKFAKEIERDLVPEWRIKYLDYKAGKKHIKAITRAIGRANGTPSLPFARKAGTPASRPTPPFATPASRPQDLQRSVLTVPEEHDDLLGGGPARLGRSPPRSIPIRNRGERQSLTEGAESDVHYGSIVPTPPDRGMSPITKQASLLELPGPAIRVPSNTTDGPAPGPRPPNSRGDSNRSLNRIALRRSASMTGARPRPGTAAERVGSQEPAHLALPHSGATFPNMTPSDLQSPRTRLRRMFTLAGPAPQRSKSRGEYDMQALDEVREKEHEFYAFLDGELDKVESFYRSKEKHAEKRLALLREQLHEMRNRRTSEIAEARRRKRAGEHNGHVLKEGGHINGAYPIPLLDPLRAKLFKPGPNSKALSTMATNDGKSDYVRRPPEDEVPYRTAKRKLKLALQEFYRGLELLKSYALLNRTAFRKLNKKYDKAVHARPPYRYMNEKVNKSWFVNSDVLESHLQAVEDLYARYFERGNRKIAAGKLRSLSKKKRDESGSAFQNGLFIGLGAVFAVQGLIYGAQLLFDDDPLVRTQTSYLLQIYGGYFLMLYLFSLFCLNAKVWTANRVNYPFIFEFDGRSQLDWRQLAEFPSFFLLLLGLFMWLNFTRYGSPAMYLYYPVILIFVAFVILFIPAPIFFHKSRRWFLYSHWRLFFAGLYPVEFRDFFLGDMYCSLTYAMCNIELFFCLYANAWDDPQQCNSNHSRLLGFFACLPPVWRFLQCIRRYRDTRNIFPHLVNCGKYTASILAGVFLSVYRLNNTRSNMAIFVAFSTVNGIYTAFWDVFMDFSLLQPHSHHPFLRDVTALKSRWPYYLIMTLDPILRFNWIFYALFTHDTQHSSIASFLIAFSEVTRRGMWTLLRVENEHCANVKQYKASRDVPLPYHLDVDVDDTDPLSSARGSSESNGGKQAAQLQARRRRDADPDADPDAQPVRSPSAARVSWTGVVARTQSGLSTGVDLPSPQTPGVGPSGSATGDAGGVVEEGRTPPGEEASMVRRRRADTIGKKSIRGMLAEAHKQDFEKRRRPQETGRSGARVDGTAGAAVDDDDDDDDEDEDLAGSEDGSDEDTRLMLDERMDLREAQMLSKRGRDED